MYHIWLLFSKSLQTPHLYTIPWHFCRWIPRCWKSQSNPFFLLIHNLVKECYKFQLISNCVSKIMFLKTSRNNIDSYHDYIATSATLPQVVLSDDCNYNLAVKEFRKQKENDKEYIAMLTTWMVIIYFRLFHNMWFKRLNSLKHAEIIPSLSDDN